MNPARKQRLIVVLFIVVAASVAVGLVTYALRQNMNLFFSPAQIANNEAPKNTRIRIGGMVVSGSIKRSENSLETRFNLTDCPTQITVIYTGILPDLFAEGEAAVATGMLRDDGLFEASEVLAKHDENYTPPEVADAMNESHNDDNDCTDLIRGAKPKAAGYKKDSGYDRGYGGGASQ